jgi:hypothetical protein
MLVSCQAADQPVDADSAAQQVVLEVEGAEQTRTLTLAELEQLEVIEGWGGTLSSAGVITPPQKLKGASLLEIASLVGGLEPGMGVNVVAKDGYSMTMSYEQLAEGDFITYDPGTGSENEVPGPLQAIVAYERDGGNLGDDGPLRLFIVSPENDNLVDGHWTVKWVTGIRLKPMSEEWSLGLEGSRTELLDRNSFESCSAPGCHQAAWTDENGNEWKGVPLYLLAGRVDGGTIHEERAYDDLFARAGYTLELFAADGYNVSIDSQETIFNKDLLLASTLNSEPLGEEDYPLRLVGSDLEEDEMVGQVARVVIKPGESVEMPPNLEEPLPSSDSEKPILPEEAVLLVFGDVTNQLTLKPENLKAMNSIQIETEHPKKGNQTYTGFRLNDLLDLAGPGSEDATLVITSSDGYAVDIPLKEVRECEDSLIVLEEDRTISLVMPGMESSYWSKMVNLLEIR